MAIEGNDDSRGRKEKGGVLLLITLLLLCLLILRLGYLQIVKYEEFFEKSENNRIYKKVVDARRGRIYDRNGEIIARNRASYQVEIHKEKVLNDSLLMARILNIKNQFSEQVFDSLIVHKAIFWGARNKKTRVLEDVGLNLVNYVFTHQDELMGVVVDVEFRREYPYGEAFSHILGYTGEVSKEDVSNDSLDYIKGDRVGRRGLENYYENYLQGKRGYEYIEVDAYGRKIRVLKRGSTLEPTPGNDLFTTLDLKLQKAMYEEFPKGNRGAAAAINPQNGEVLGFISYPSYDANLFSLAQAELKREWTRLVLDPRKPLSNRVVQGVYPPASLFKFFPGIAGLEKGIIGFKDSHAYKACKGGFRFGRRVQKCWKLTGHGYVSLLEALRHSCDIYFYQLGLSLGMDRINSVAIRFGLGEPTGIDLKGEYSGLLMDSVTYDKRNRKRRGWRWTRGQILNLVIGQGELVTPLQMTNAYAGLGNTKFLYEPFIVKNVMSLKGEFLYKRAPKVKNMLGLSDKHSGYIREALEDIVINGTGKSVRMKKIRVGGKTGSAENPLGDLTHSWFGGVAPIENPTIAIVAVMENAGHGGTVAAPYVGRVLKRYFKEEEEKTQ
jgi:penicillin-binding protein 2